MAKLEIDTEAELTTETIEALRPLLEAVNHHVLDERAFLGLKKQGAREPADALAALQAEHDALKTTHTEAAEKLRELERAAMSEAERVAAEAKDREAALAEAQAKAAASEKQAAKAITAMKAKALAAEMPNLLANVRPELAEAARLVAQANLKGLGITDEGELTVQGDDGSDLVGDDAKSHFGTWWSTQGHFHAPQQPGPGTAGSPAPAPKANDRFQPISPAVGSYEERQAIAAAADAAERK